MTQNLKPDKPRMKAYFKKIYILDSVYYKTSETDNPLVSQTAHSSEKTKLQLRENSR